MYTHTHTHTHILTNTVITLSAFSYCQRGTRWPCVNVVKDAYLDVISVPWFQITHLTIGGRVYYVKAKLLPSTDVNMCSVYSICS